MAYSTAGRLSKTQCQLGRHRIISFIDRSADGTKFAMRVYGDTMVDTPHPDAMHSFPDRCRIVVDPQVPPKDRSFVVVRLAETFNALVVSGDHRYLVPINPLYPGYEANPKMTLLGTVVSRRL